MLCSDGRELIDYRYMKKTLIITLEYPPKVGGIASYVDQFALAMGDPSEVMVYAPQMKDAKKWDNIREFAIVRKKPYFPRFIWPRWLRMYFQVRKIVKEQGIGMLYIHHTLPVGYIGYLIKKRLKIPFILFSHGTDVLAGTRTNWKKRMVRMVAKEARAMVFNSESLKRRLLRVLPEFEKKSLVLYPCPDEDLYTPVDPVFLDALRQRYALQGKKVMLSIGRIEEGKGYTHMVRLLPTLLKRIPNLVWIVIGEGPKRKQMIASIQEKGLHNVVRYLGEVPHQEIKPFYYLADMFALLTHPDNGKEEGLGLVFLEAAAAGLPVVAGRSGGVPEAVLHTQTGVIVDIYKGDTQVVDAMYQLLSNKEYAQRLGEQAKARMKSEFRWRNQMSRLAPWISEKPKT